MNDKLFSIFIAILKGLHLAFACVVIINLFTADSLFKGVIGFIGVASSGTVLFMKFEED